MKSLYDEEDSDDEATTESTEKLYTSDTHGRFDIVLDIVKTNTSLNMEE